MYQRKKRVKVQKLMNKYSKLAINLNCTSVYTFFMKIFYFFFLKKARYNWYNSNYCCIPTFNRSFLYLRAWYNKGTIGTIEKLVLIIKAYLSKSEIIVVYQRNKGRAHMNDIIKFIFYKSWSIQSYA